MLCRLICIRYPCYVMQEDEILFQASKNKFAAWNSTDVVEVEQTAISFIKSNSSQTARN